jgi:acetyl-CoA carboxylase biotin carboxyl carrier protein
MNEPKKSMNSREEASMSQKIDYDEIAKLVNFLEEKKLAQFELEVEGFKIKISRSVPGSAMSFVPEARSVMSGPQAEAPNQDPGQEALHAAAVDLHLVASPMVGTFYRCPDPSSPPFVEIGDQVKKGQTLCIIEAMKLMNEIEADIDGTVQDIFVENAKPVEYGQKLFAIQPLS